MPLFKSEDEAIEVHKNYAYDTDHEGKFNPSHSGWLRTKQLIQWIPDNEPIILGVGCNSGGLERTILRHRRGSIIYGIDVNPAFVFLAKQKGIFAQEARAENLPYEDEFFNVVILSEILEHVFNPKKVLEEAMRVLKEGGLVIGSVPHPRSVNAKKRSIEEHAYHTRVYTRKTLKNLLKPLNNLEIVDIHYRFGKSPQPQWICWRGTK